MRAHQRQLAQKPPAPHEPPTPYDGFYEHEVAKARGIPWHAWQRVPPVDRARMLAHEQYCGLRESLREELRKRHPEAEGGGPDRKAKNLADEMAADYFPAPKK